MKKILVTGATGFIGKRLVTELVNRDYQVNCALRKMPANTELSDGCKNFVVGDINFRTDWNNALTDVDAVIHLAARVHVMNETDSNPLQRFRENNVDSTVNLARQAAEAGVKRFVYLSSIKVNGESTSEQPFTEEDSPNPLDPYGQSKYEAELELMRIQEETGLQVVIIRPVLVYGPGVKGNFLRLMKIVKKGIPLPFAKLDNKRSMIGLDNLVDLIIQCVGHPAAAGQVFLASDGHDFSTELLVKLINDMLGKKPRLFWVPSIFLTAVSCIPRFRVLTDRLFGSLQVDSSKSRNLLNWTPPKSTTEGIRDTVRYYLDSETH